MNALPALPLAEDEALSQAEAAYRQLRDKLIMLEIRPGEPINDGQLAAELGFGRTPVREAIKRLEVDHLVVSYPRRGTFATSVDFTELADVSEIRELLEPLALAGLPAGPATPCAANSGTSPTHCTAGSRGPGGSARPHAVRPTVHRLIYKAAANPHLEDTLIRYDNLATRIWCLVLDKVPSVSGHIVEHVELLTAIADGDEDRAAELALHHVVSFEESVRKVL